MTPQPLRPKITGRERADWAVLSDPVTRSSGAIPLRWYRRASPHGAILSDPASCGLECGGTPYRARGLNATPVSRISPGHHSDDAAEAASRRSRHGDEAVTTKSSVSKTSAIGIKLSAAAMAGVALPASASARSAPHGTWLIRFTVVPLLGIANVHGRQRRAGGEGPASLPAPERGLLLAFHPLWRPSSEPGA